jgi:hypothetical protein
MATHLSPFPPHSQRTAPPTLYRYDRLRLAVGLLMPIVALLVISLR